MDHKYTCVEDFIADESFQEYCLEGSLSATKKWEQYKRNNEDQVPLIEEAHQFVSMMFVEPKTSVVKSTKKQSSLPYKTLLKACAVVLVIVASMWGIKSVMFTSKNFKMISEIADAEKHSILLTDLSKIELRKNSSIKFLESWENSAEREVWLDGEAYFQVERSKSRDKVFKVHLPKGSIKVLGTKFLVKSDSTSSKVILEEGKILFQDNNKSYELSPGDMLSFDDEMVSIRRNQNLKMYDSWRRNELSFDNTPIETVISTINNSYDLQVELGNNKLKNRKITTTINQNNPKLLLEAIAGIYDIKIVYKENKIILK